MGDMCVLWRGEGLWGTCVCFGEVKGYGGHVCALER